MLLKVYAALVLFADLTFMIYSKQNLKLNCKKPIEEDKEIYKSWIDIIGLQVFTCEVNAAQVGFIWNYFGNYLAFLVIGYAIESFYYSLI